MRPSPPPSPECLLLAIACAFTLTACGSGSKGSVTIETPPSTTPIAENRQPGISDARLLPFDNLKASLLLAADRAPVITTAGEYGSITQSSDSASVAAAFANSNVTLSVSPENRGGTVLSSAQHAVEETLDRSKMVKISGPLSLPNGHSEYKDWTLFSYSETGSASAFVTVSWNPATPSDFLANGYWMLLDGDLRNDLISRATVGSFVYGSEFSNARAPVLPTSGTATFRGRASGVYVFHYGDAWQQQNKFLPNTEESGIFTGIITLDVNFGLKTIKGEVGRVDEALDQTTIINETAGDIYLGGNRGAKDELLARYSNRKLTGNILALDPTVSNRPSLSRIKLGSAKILNDGTFQSTDVTFEVDYYPGGDTEGHWGGRFSNVAVNDKPRLVGGTLGLRWSNPTATSTDETGEVHRGAGSFVSVGTFFATPVD